jgi:hypothetical protein
MTENFQAKYLPDANGAFLSGYFFSGQIKGLFAAGRRY